jgi:hypothetical protein
MTDTKLAHLLVAPVTDHAGAHRLDRNLSEITRVLFKIRAEGAREKAIKSVPVLLRPGLLAYRPRSQLLVNHSGLFLPPWGSDLTIPKKQGRERCEGGTLFLTRTSTS